MTRSITVRALPLIVAAAIGAGLAVAATSAHAEPTAPSVRCYDAALIAQEYNATQVQTDRARLYDAYIKASATCLSHPRPGK